MIIIKDSTMQSSIKFYQKKKKKKEIYNLILKTNIFWSKIYQKVESISDF